MNKEPHFSDSLSDSLIDELYHRSAKEKPPKSIDRLILGKAHRASRSNKTPKVKEQITSTSPFSGGWKAPFSMAAVMVLGLVVILKLGVSPENPDAKLPMVKTAPVEAVKKQDMGSGKVSEKKLLRAVAPQDPSAETTNDLMIISPDDIGMELEVDSVIQNEVLPVRSMGASSDTSDKEKAEKPMLTKKRASSVLYNQIKRKEQQLRNKMSSSPKADQSVESTTGVLEQKSVLQPAPVRNAEIREPPEGVSQGDAATSGSYSTPVVEERYRVAPAPAAPEMNIEDEAIKPSSIAVESAAEQQIEQEWRRYIELLIEAGDLQTARQALEAYKNNYPDADVTEFEERLN